MARPKSVNSIMAAKDLTVDPASIATATATDVTGTVKGLRKGYPVIVWAEALTTGIMISNAHCSAADTVKFRLENVTGSTIDPASQTFRVVQL